jgi:hypothetical protein
MGARDSGLAGLPEVGGAGMLGGFSLWLILMRRFLFLAHRYLGIGLGLIMVLWCLSGFVMMYMPYPSLSLSERLAGSPPLDLSDCCETQRIGSLGMVDVYGFTVEMLADRPVVRFDASGGQAPIVDLSSGELIEGIDSEAARTVARSFSEQSGIGGGELGLEQVQQDQWTVTRSYDRFRPLYRFSVGDRAGTELYVASSNGQVVQLTTASERFWNWLGAVPHWLYPIFLRQHDWLWAQVVIWLSLAGVFLTAIGLYIGITQLRSRRSGRRSPYRGTALWHHYAGLVFGIFVLTWVGSGFVSMNPWGMFDFGGGEAARQRLQGVPLYSGDAEDFLQRLPAADLPAGTVVLEGYTLRGRLFVLAYREDGSATRLDGQTLQASPLTDEWPALTQAVAGSAPIGEAGRINREDAYYYTGHDLQARLPIYRVILDDAERTRIYLDTRSGEMVAYFDHSQKLYRWLFSGLHSLDFTSWLRTRPFRDLLVWLLMLGVTAATVTGAYMGFRRILR